MVTQSEQVLESGLIKTLMEMNYEYISIKEEDNLYANFKKQLEKHNKRELSLHKRKHFTNKEFEKICIYLEGGTRFEKAKKLRDLYPLETEDGERIWVEFLNKNKWCQNEFQVSNQITVEGRKKCRYDVTILINGLPLVQIELKKRGVELKEAYNQIQRYHKTSFHGLFDYIHDNYERKLLKFFINFSSTDPNFRLTLIKDRYIELIEEEFEREDAKVFELAKLCLSLVTNKVDFIECNGPKIFELFQKLSKYLVNDENAKYIIRAFLHLLTANDNFVLGFIKLGMLKPFVELEINDEDYLIGLFDLLNIICNFSEEASIYLVEHQIIEFTCYFFKNYYSDLLITKVIVLLTNLIFYIPQSIKIIQDNHITVDIINIYYEDDTKSAGFIKAVVNYCVIAMGFASSIYYHQLNAQGCYTIIVENINLIEPIYYRFTLNVILRGFPDGKPEIKKRLQDFLKENDEFIEWLEYMRSEDNVNISKLAAKILNLIYPETPIQIM